MKGLLNELEAVNILTGSCSPSNGRGIAEPPPNSLNPSAPLGGDGNLRILGKFPLFSCVLFVLSIENLLGRQTLHNIPEPTMTGAAHMLRLHLQFCPHKPGGEAMSQKP